MRRRQRDRALFGVALAVLLALLVLCFWPVPNKYPVVLPSVALASAAIGAYRYRFSKDDVGAVLVWLSTLAALGVWTLAVWLELGLPLSMVLWLGVMTLPVVALVIATINSGAADDPYESGD